MSGESNVVPLRARPTIIVNTEESRITNEARAVLAASPHFYERYGVIGLVDPNRGQPQFVQATPEVVRHFLSEEIDFFRDGNKVTPPRYVAGGVLALPDRSMFRMLHGIATTPIIRKDGSIARTNGYDDASCCWISIPEDFDVPVNDYPTRADVVCALDLLSHFLKDFPFDEDFHRSAAIAYLLTIVGRMVFDGPSPLFFVCGTTPGAGKGLILTTLSMIATGNEPMKFLVGDDPSDSELKKEVLSILMEGHRSVVWDNAASGKNFGSSVIDGLLTSTTFSQRLLGINKTVNVENRTAWGVTGNGIGTAGDLARRILPIVLTPNEERPEERDLPSLTDYAINARGALLGAAMTLIRGWFVAGRPNSGARLGSYEGWSAIRYIVTWAGLPDPCLGTQKMRRANDQASDQMLLIHDGFRDAFGKTSPSTRDIIQRATHMSENDLGNEMLHEIAALAAKGNAATRLGTYYGKYVGRWFENRRLVKDDTDRPRRWRLETRV